MVVAVEYGLDRISDQLRDKGYTVVAYPDYMGAVDAFIYKDQMLGSLDNSIENCMLANAHGILIINGANKTIGEIEDILRKRLYSPLF